jgi:mRNA interferase RelE/StbE
MTEYIIKFKSSVEKDIKKLEKRYINKIIGEIEALRNNPFPTNSKKLVKSEKSYRLRVGDYRIIYQVDNAINKLQCSMFVIVKMLTNSVKSDSFFLLHLIRTRQSMLFT